jgi:hypothetical protein
MAHSWDMQKRRQEAWAKWRGLVSEQGASGQSVAAFCRDRGLPASQFFAWKRRLRQATPERFVELQVAGAPAQPATAQNCAIEIRLGCGRSVMVEPGFDANHLRAVLAVLEAQT